MSIDEIAARLSLPKTTVYYWVKDLPLGRPRRANPGQRRGNAAMQRKYRLLREAAYLDGLASFDALATDRTFRDFVCMYVGEGSKRSRNRVAIGNSDPAVIRLADRWLARLSARPRRYSVQYHADQSIEEVREFWAAQVGVDPGDIGLQRKSNSGRLGGRTWRSPHGVLTITVGDTLLRARLQAWMDRLEDSWV